jgi:hypothetical protein
MMAPHRRTRDAVGAGSSQATCNPEDVGDPAIRTLPSLRRPRPVRHGDRLLSIVAVADI